MNIPSYDIISNHRQEYKGGGTAIIMKQGIPYKRHMDLDIMVEKKIESVFIEISTKGGTPVIVGSLYKPPNMDATGFITSLREIISKSNTNRKKPEMILGMDHNLDLLKCEIHKGTHDFLDLMLQHQLYPSITRPSTVTQMTATLIENIFISEKFHRLFDSAVILRDISDHLPLLCLVKQTKLLDKSPLEFDSRLLNDTKLCEIKHKLYSVDWVGLLNSESCDENFNKCNAKINKVMDQIAPLKTVRISAKHRYKEPWMSKCIEISSRKNNELYKATLKEGCTNKTCERYKNYWNCYNKLKRSAKSNYYK